MLIPWKIDAVTSLNLRNAYLLKLIDPECQLEYNIGKSARHLNEVKMYADLIRRFCKGCKQEKTVSEFYVRKDPTRAKYQKCKPCILEERRRDYHKDKTKYQEQAKRYRLKNPLAKRNTKLKQAYGIGIEEYEAILKSQGGVCAGCKRNVTWKRCGKTMPMNIDHCHKTGQIRGILCLHCNRGLGCAEDNIQILKNWINYLEKYQKLEIKNSNDNN